MKRTPVLVGMLLPCRIDLRVCELSGGRFRFRYVESFPRRPGLRRQMIKGAALLRRLLTGLQRMRVRVGRDSITLVGIDSREGVGALIASEFAGWVASGVGRVALRHAMRNAPPEGGRIDADFDVMNLEPSQLAAYPDVPWEPAKRRQRR